MKNGFVAAVGALVTGIQGAILYTQNKIRAQQTELINQQASLLKLTEEHHQKEFLKQGIDAAETVLKLMIKPDDSDKQKNAKNEMVTCLVLARYSLYDQGSTHSAGLHELLEKTSPDIKYHLAQAQHSLPSQNKRNAQGTLKDEYRPEAPNVPKILRELGSQDTMDAQEKRPGNTKFSPSKP